MGTGSPLHSVSVAAVITNSKDEVLVIQRRDNGSWEPPGGVLELDEDIYDGLRREVREETGLDIVPERLAGVYKNMTLGVVALVFRCRPTGGTLIVSEETKTFRWINRNEIPQILGEVFAVRLLDALSGKETQIRAHDGKTLLETGRRSNL